MSGLNDRISSRETMEDLVNDLKAENAQLRRELILRDTPVSNTDHPACVMTQNCSMCTVLESQVKRLSSEIDRMRAQMALAGSNSDDDVRQLLDVLAKENRRRSRMESIIYRQQDYIRDLSMRMKDIVVERSILDDRFLDKRSDSSESQEVVQDVRIPERPWELDMDDLFRQLDDLDEKVHDVEEQTNRLTHSAKAAFAPITNETTHARILLGPGAKNGAGVLDRIMNGST
jgi:chromosome segregation ATPase